MFFSGLVVFLGLLAQSSAECSRAMLQEATAAYSKYITTILHSRIMS